jgi:hypothetical protein
MVIAVIMSRVQAAPDIPDVELWKRPLVAGDALAFYLGKLALPIRLAPDYGRSPQAIERSGAVLWTSIVPFIAIVLLYLARRRLCWLAAALFVIPLLPLLGLIPFDMQQYSTVTDHYLYLPVVGLGLLVATAIASAKVQRRAAIVGASVVVLILGALTFRQALRWQDMRGLFAHNLDVNPRSYLSHGMLAVLALEGNDLATAQREGEASLAIKETPTALDTLAYVAMRQERRAEASRYARRSLDLGGTNLERVKKLMRLGAAIEDYELVDAASAAWARIDNSPERVEWLAGINAGRRRKASSQPAV